MKLRSCLCLIWMLLWSAAAAAELSAEHIRKYLPGTWLLEMKADDLTVVGSTTYHADGSAVSEGLVTSPELNTRMRFKGKWTVEGNQLIVEATESSMPDLVPVGAVSRDKVLAIDEHLLSYVDESGERFTEKRSHAVSKPD